MKTLIPAYGRDYKTAAAAAAAADYRAGRDFIIADISDPWDRKPANVRDLGYPVRLRFAGLRRATVVEG